MVVQRDNRAVAVDEKSEVIRDIVHLGRLGLSGERRDVEIYLRRMLRRATKDNAPLAQALSNLLAGAPSPAAPLRDAGAGIVPVDRDSRLQLLRHEDPVILDHDPILPAPIADALRSVVAERKNMERLAISDLTPTRTLLFTGAPGVGKTLSARWLAARLGKPLLTLDLSSVISSFLGRTGANLRHVLDYAKSVESVLLLDEFDAIAKRRGDDTELGELKRLVTVLLQEIDLWPSDRMLIAATNHGELLDRAVWRRFDIVLDFPLPSKEEIETMLRLSLSQNAADFETWRNALVELCRGKSYSDVERLSRQIRRRLVVNNAEFGDSVVAALAVEIDHLSLAERKQLGETLQECGLSDRKIAALGLLTRDTLRSMKRKRSQQNTGTSGPEGSK